MKGTNVSSRARPCIVTGNPKNLRYDDYLKDSVEFRGGRVYWQFDPGHTQGEPEPGREIFFYRAGADNGIVARGVVIEALAMDRKKANPLDAQGRSYWRNASPEVVFKRRRNGKFYSLLGIDILDDLRLSRETGMIPYRSINALTKQKQPWFMENTLNVLEGASRETDSQNEKVANFIRSTWASTSPKGAEAQLAMPLDPPGRRLLTSLVAHLPNVSPGHPETYVTYKQVHDALKLSQLGKTYGDSLRRQGMSSLASWAKETNRPGITGLIVEEASREPGEGYFRLYGKSPDAYEWWTGQIKQAKKFDWSSTIDDPPSANEFAETFRKWISAGRLSEIEREMLVCHYNAPGFIITARQMSALMGWGGQRANIAYGALGNRLAGELGWVPKERAGREGFHVAALILGQRSEGEFEWIMRPQVAQALELLRWPELARASPTARIGDSVTEHHRYTWQRRLERDSRAARFAKAHHGHKCQACEMSFAQEYGDIGHEFIEAHHLVPVAEIEPESERVYGPEEFAVLCSNCHRMIHRWPDRFDPRPWELEAFRRMVQKRMRR